MPDDFEAREAELDRKQQEIRVYSRHAISFGLGFGFAFAGVLLGGVSRWLTAAGLVAAGLAWIVSGRTAWQSGIHMFGGLRSGGFGQFVVTRKSRDGARIVGLLLIAFGVLSIGAAFSALR